MHMKYLDKPFVDCTKLDNDEFKVELEEMRNEIDELTGFVFYSIERIMI